MNRRSPPNAAARRLVLVLAAALIGGAAEAQSGRGTLHGYVAFDDERPYGAAAAAQITLDGTRPGEALHYAAQSDTYGSFDLPSLRMGEYRLRIEASGFKPYVTTLYIPSDFEARLSVLLHLSAKASKPASRGVRP